MFVVTGCDRAEMLDPVEEPLDAVAQLVDARAERGLLDAMVERTDVGIRPLCGDLGHNCWLV